MKKSDNRSDRVFTIEIQGRPILSFAAISHSEAQSLCKEEWLRDDLSKCKSDGEALWDGGASITVRMATANEMSLYWQAAKAADDTEDMVLAYLVELDSANEGPVEPGGFPPSRMAPKAKE